MDQYQRNKINAKYCLGCINLHIGTEVDHNHCDRFATSLWYERRANGHHKSRCAYKNLTKQALKEG